MALDFVAFTLIADDKFARIGAQRSTQLFSDIEFATRIAMRHTQAALPDADGEKLIEAARQLLSDGAGPR